MHVVLATVLPTMCFAPRDHNPKVYHLKVVQPSKLNIGKKIVL